jgi:transposase, IS5 family
MIQLGFFDLQDRLHTIDKNGDPLAKINETVNGEMFRPALEKARDKGRQSTVGPKGYDVILLFKILILQSLYNLLDDATEFQILDQHSFGRFLGLHISQKVPTPPPSGVFGKTSSRPVSWRSCLRPLMHTFGRTVSWR